MTLSIAGMEELRTPRYKFNRQSQEASRLLYVPTWSALDTLYTQVFPEAVGGNPATADTMPGFPWLVASEMTVDAFVTESLDSSVPPTCPKGAQVEIIYRAKPFTQTTGGSPYQRNDDLPGAHTPGGGGPGSPGAPENQQVFVSYEVEIGGQMVTVEGLGFQWVGDNHPVGKDAKVGIFEPSLEHTITMHFVTQPPWAAIRRCMGHVNRTLFLGARRGCLLFHGLRGKREITIAGNRQWELTYRFSERDLNVSGAVAIGWNYYYRPSARPAGYERLKRSMTNEDGPYLEEDFANLFVPGGN